MYKHIFVPTDGSDLSEATARQAVAFAKQIGARITAFHAKPNLSATHFFGEDKTAAPSSLDQIDEQIEKDVQKSLGFVEKLCSQADVQCDVISSPSNTPYEAIVDAATRSGADLIFMASHGRKGIKAKILGSETLRTLTHSPIPVLVHSYGEREPPSA
ncbi:universal stress protein [Thiocapsa sp.]|uniref:universal stress protein n=1 Tax=Thiocapsa sp. TaxID=2024551 RepID=UPI0025CB95E9|nr:universal stress protein [Thiocapsa sp.]